MEKRSLLAVGLALVVLIAWSVIFPPPKRPDTPPAPASVEQKTAETAPSASGAQATAPAGNQAPAAAAATPGTGPAQTDRIEAAAEEKRAIDTGLARVELSNRGGRILSWTLTHYKDDDGHPYELVSPAVTLANPPVWPLLVTTGQVEVDKALEGALFRMEQSAAPDGGPIITFTWSDGLGLEARKVLSFRKNTYFVDIRAEIRKSGKELPVLVSWGPGLGEALAKQRKSRFDFVGQAVFGSEQDVLRRTPGAVSVPERISPEAGTAPRGDFAWAGLEEQYFAAIFLADGTGRISEAVVTSRDILPAPGEKLEKHVFVSVPVPADQPLVLFAGPKEYELLKQVGRGTVQLIHFSQPVFGVGFLSPLIGLLAQGLYLLLRWLHGLIPNWGVAIILLTTLIRLAFYPITQKAFVKMRRSQQEMQAVSPKVNAIKAKYAKQKGAEARQKANQEVMDLYRKEGINPFSAMTGCLPMLLQLPLLYGMYNVLSVSIELRGAPFFGWIRDLSTFDPWYVTPILMGVTMFIQQRMAMTRVTDPQQRAQQRMMQFMPIMFAFMFLKLPSGLTLYWFVSNLLQIGQQVLINRQADKALAPPGGDDPPGKGRKKSTAGSSGGRDVQSERLPSGASAMTRGLGNGGEDPAGSPQSS